MIRKKNRWKIEKNSQMYFHHFIVNGKSCVLISLHDKKKTNRQFALFNYVNTNESFLIDKNAKKQYKSSDNDKSKGLKVFPHVSFKVINVFNWSSIFYVL
jgi:hypothetical protein